MSLPKDYTTMVLSTEDRLKTEAMIARLIKGAKARGVGEIADFWAFHDRQLDQVAIIKRSSPIRYEKHWDRAPRYMPIPIYDYTVDRIGWV